MKRICCFVVCLILWGTSSLSAATGTITVTDMAGREVSHPFDPERIICIGPGALRLIVYLQAESRVVGVDEVEKTLGR